jgi:hypothetical protein
MWFLWAPAVRGDSTSEHEESETRKPHSTHDEGLPRLPPAPPSSGASSGRGAPVCLRAPVRQSALCLDYPCWRSTVSRVDATVRGRWSKSGGKEGASPAPGSEGKRALHDDGWPCRGRPPTLSIGSLLQVLDPKLYLVAAIAQDTNRQATGGSRASTLREGARTAGYGRSPRVACATPRNARLSGLSGIDFLLGQQCRASCDPRRATAAGDRAKGVLSDYRLPRGRCAPTRIRRWRVWPSGVERASSKVA